VSILDGVRTDRNILVACGAALVAVAIGLEAWHSHGLAVRLEAAEWAAFGRALDQHYLTALGLILAGLLKRRVREPLRLAAAAGLAAGLLAFSGSIYLRSLGVGAPAIAPAGGSTLILSWVVLAAAAALGPASKD